MSLIQETAYLSYSDIFHLLPGSQQYFDSFLESYPLSQKQKSLLHSGFYPVPIMRDFVAYLRISSGDSPSGSAPNIPSSVLKNAELLLDSISRRHAFSFKEPNSTYISGEPARFRELLAMDYHPQSCLRIGHPKLEYAINNCDFLNTPHPLQRFHPLFNPTNPNSEATLLPIKGTPYFVSKLYPGFLLDFGVHTPPDSIMPKVQYAGETWIHMPSLACVLPFFLREPLVRDMITPNMLAEISFLENLRTPSFLKTLNNIRHRHPIIRDHLCQFIFNYRGASWLKKSSAYSSMEYYEFLHHLRIDAPRYGQRFWNDPFQDDNILQNILLLMGAVFLDRRRRPVDLEELENNSLCPTDLTYDGVHVVFPADFQVYAKHLLFRESRLDWGTLSRHSVLSYLNNPENF